MPPQEVVAVDSENQQPIGKRRRRRRRKGGGATQAGTANGEIQPQSGDSVDTDSDSSSDSQSLRNDALRSDDQGGGKRRKRNRRKKNKQSQPQPAPSQAQAQVQPQPRANEQAKFFRKSNNGGAFSQQGNGGGGRRNRQQRRGPQSFVGPMDHMYRGSDNLADSTVGTNGNFRGRNQNSNLNVNGNIASYQDSQTVAIPEDAPVRVFCFIDDLFFHAKIRETAKMVGIKVEFVKTDKEQIERVIAVAAEHPLLVVVDLNNLNAKPIPLIKKLRPKLSKGSSLIGFVSHVQGELKMEAQEAGCDVVMPRSAFSSNLPNILRRYLDEEKDEPNFNTEGAMSF